MPFDLLTDPSLALRLDDRSPFAVNADGTGGTPADGGPCAFWGDLGPNGWHATAYPGHNVPAYAANALNGRPALVWPTNRALGTTLSLGAPAGINAAEAADFTLLVVAAIDDNNDTNCIFARWDGTGDRWHINSPTPPYVDYGALFTQATVVDSNRAIPGTDPYPVYRVFCNGAPTQGHPGVLGAAGGTVPVMIGSANGGGGNFLAGTVFAVYLYARPLSPGELMQAEQQIRARYSVAWPGAAAPALVVWDGNSFSEDGGLIADVFGLPAMSAYPPSAFFNLAWGTKTTAIMNEFDALDADSLYDALAGYGKPVVSLAWEHTNDLTVTFSAATTFANCQTYQAARRAKGFRRVLGTMLPRDGQLTYRAALNPLIYANAASLADALADVASDPLMGQDGEQDNTAYYNGDGTHPNAAGRVVLAPYFASAIVAASAPVRPRRRARLSPLCGALGPI